MFRRFECREGAGGVVAKGAGWFALVIVTWAGVGCAGVTRTGSRASAVEHRGRESTGVVSGDAHLAAGTSTPRSKTAAPAGATVQEDAKLVVLRALMSVAEQRGLPPKREVEGRWVSRAELLKVVDRSMADSMPGAVVSANEAMLVGLGVVPQDFDYVGSMRALMGAELAGLYEPKDRAMYLARDLGEAATAATLAHELVHALQDQHFGLESQLEWSSDRGDEVSALHALAEGDATLAMLEYAQPGMEVAGEAVDMAIRLELEATSASSAVPGILTRSAAAAYTDGILFVGSLKRRLGWEGVDAVWRSPPVSTEQILHPEKYESREVPEVVSVPSAPDEGFGPPVYQDVVGEQGLRILLEEWVPRRTAIAGAGEWGGDRVAVYSKGSEYAIGWRVRYDTASAATRGGVAFTRGVFATAMGLSGLSGTGAAEAERLWAARWVCRERQGLGPFGIMGRGRELMVVLGPFDRHGAAVVSESTCDQARAWAAKAFGRPE